MACDPLTSSTDLRPLFGALSRVDHDRLLERLRALDGRLLGLASDATAHVGVPYKAIPLELCVRATDADICGGASGEAGDIWFELTFMLRGMEKPVAPPWVVESRLIVFCVDRPEPRGESNTHDLVHLEEPAPTAAEVVEVLESHVTSITAALCRFDRAMFTRSLHADLP